MMSLPRPAIKRPWHPLARQQRQANSPRWPTMILIGGVSGSGKSHLARALARKLDIQHVLSSDAVRQILRAAIPANEAPALHASSFRVAESLAEDRPKRLRIIQGFEQQAHRMMPSLHGVIERHHQEGVPLILEGVHLTPDALATFDNIEGVLAIILSVRSRHVHQQRFLQRAHETIGRRSAERYLEHLGVIRLLQRHLERRALMLDLPLIQSDQPNLVGTVLEHIRTSQHAPRYGA